MEGRGVCTEVKSVNTRAESCEQGLPRVGEVGLMFCVSSLVGVVD